jgi:hypothetical protein
MRRVVPVLAAAVAVAVLAPSGRAAIVARPQDVPADRTRTIDVDFSNELNAAVASVVTRIPEDAVLVSATASDPAWMPTRNGPTVEWRGGALAPGRHLHVRLALRFARAGETTIVARMTYAGGASMEAPLLVDVHGSPSQTDVLVVLAAGVVIFLGAILVFVLGRRALRD